MTRGVTNEKLTSTISTSLRQTWPVESSMRNSHQPSLHPTHETNMTRGVINEKLTSTISTSHPWDKHDPWSHQWETHINHLYIPPMRQTWPVESPMGNSHQPSLHPTHETNMTRGVINEKLTSTISTSHPWDKHDPWSHQWETHINHLYIPPMRQTWPVESPMRNSHQPSLHPTHETNMTRGVINEKLTSTISTSHPWDKHDPWSHQWETHINHLYIPPMRQTWPVESPMRNSHQPSLHPTHETNMTRGVTNEKLTSTISTIPETNMTRGVINEKLTSTISTYHPWDKHDPWSHQWETHINHLYIPPMRQTWPVE